MRNRCPLVALVLAALLAVPAVASAQVIYYPPPAPRVIPPRVVVAPVWRVRRRVRWVRRPRVVVVAPRVVVSAPPVYAPVYAPPAPVYAPPVYAPPPPPVYYTPAPLPPIPPPLVAPAPLVYRPYPPCPVPAPQLVVVHRAPPVPGWQAHVGLGVRGTGVVDNAGWNNLGIGGELLFRVANHLSLELAAEYQKNTAGPADGAFDRIDVPATFGMRIYLGPPRWIVSPYFVVAGGFDYAAEDLKLVTDEAYYFDGQLGGGLELRLGQHVALTADVRFDGKKRLDTPSDAVLAVRTVDNHAAQPLGDEYGAQFHLGFALYF